MLSGKLHTDLLLFHTYIDYATMGAYGGGGWIVDEFTERKKHSKQGLELLTEGLESLSNELEPGDYKPVISFDLNDCNLEMAVADLLRQNNVELIVMGARSHDKEEALYGDDTNSIVNHATCPVLIVPSKTDLEQIRKVIFATDFDQADFKAIHYLAKLGRLFHYQLEIIHVINPASKEAVKSTQGTAFKEQLMQFKYQGLTYHEVGGKDVISRLNGLSTETGTGLLALFHHQRPWLIRLFAHSETKRALAKQKMPLLIFPSGMVDFN
ncbi:universal stress protein [Mucilaginibacter sp. AW1-7]|uniref:universal stress protein n=1 Tax=Mucilaginibacter sp. AW1-7 TaxID=3349874 RepID=UPI003F7390C6